MEVIADESIAETLRRIYGRIRDLQAEIADLQLTAQTLRKAFSTSTPDPHPPAVEEPKTRTTPIAEPVIPPSGVEPRKVSRKEAVVQLLREHGPLKRSEIMEELDLPVGTASVVLQDKTLFEKTADGRWTLASALVGR